MDLARGDLIGVLIDGARMASPRLLATALEAARLHTRPVIGTLSFHLGPDVQMRSVERRLLPGRRGSIARVGGLGRRSYRLFEIRFAEASRKGWFAIPAETNALFLTREHWTALGGYEPAFVSPGGGLANPDMWARACADTSGRVILLLGEATFHQFHGGIATSATKQSPILPQFRPSMRHTPRAFSFRPENLAVLGQLHPKALASVQRSAEIAAGSVAI